ncbi:hypothetical protein Anas_14525, partial [Armadillidium nasatum]
MKYFEQETNSFEFIDVKSEIEVKKEPFDIEDEEGNSFEYLNVKSEIEVKEDPLDIEEEVEKKDRFHIEEEEETPKYEVSHHKISCFDQNE